MKAAFLLSILLLGGGIAEAQAPRGSDAAALASARAEARAAAERSERLEAQARRATGQAQRPGSNRRKPG